MPHTEHTLRLALAVQDAARLHEESYDKAASTAAAMEADRHIGVWGQGVDFSRFYRKDIEDASEESAVKHCLDGSGPLIHYALAGRWNESLAWASEVLNKAPPA